MTLHRVNPAELSPPTGFSHAVTATGSRLVFLAGQTALDGDGKVVGAALPAQFERALTNLLTALRHAGGTPADLARVTVYATASPTTATTHPNWAASGGGWRAATTPRWRWWAPYGCGTIRRWSSWTGWRSWTEGRGGAGRMPQVETGAGSIAYEDTGGDGVPLVLLHGPAQDGTVWRHVTDELGAGFRCVVPTLPYGSHRAPLRPGTVLTPRTMALLIGEFADALKLGDETVFVENDGGRLQQLAAERPERVGRLVIAGCEAFDNYPPRAGGKMMAAAARIPGGIAAMAHGLAFRPARRIPGTGYAVMAHKPVAHDLIDRWIEPLRKDPAARRVLVRYLRAARPSEMMEAAEGLRAYDRPALVVWGRQDRMMPPEHGRRLAELLSQGRLVELDDCRTLIPLDRPEGLAAAIRDFVARTSPEAPSATP